MDRGRNLQPPAESRASLASRAISSSQSPLGPQSHTLQAPRDRFFSATQLAPPIPEDNINNYDVERVKDSLEYARKRLISISRRPSPVQRRYFSLYARSCEGLISAFDLEPHVEKEEIIAKNRILVQTIEKDLVNLSWPKACITEEEQELQDELLELRRLAYYARYGDWTMFECHQIRLASKGIQYKGRLEARRLWTKISREIEEQWPLWQRGGKKEPDTMPTIYAVWLTANKCGLNFDECIQAIHSYAKRNQLLHTDFAQLVRQKKYSRIADKLYEDLRDLPNVIPADEDQEHEFMEAFLRRQISDWFEFDNSEDPDTWICKPALRRYAQDTIEDEGNARARAEKHEANIAAKTQKDVEEANIKNLLHSQAGVPIQPGVLPPGGVSLKRKAEQAGIHDIENESEATSYIKQQQQSAWHAHVDSEAKYKTMQENFEALKTQLKHQEKLKRDYEISRNKMISLQNTINVSKLVSDKRWPSNAVQEPRRSFSKSTVAGTQEGRLQAMDRATRNKGCSLR